MEYMAGLEDNAFDLAIVDPPYGHGNKAIRNGKNKTKLATEGGQPLFDNSSAPDPEYFQELMRVSRNQIIWGANHFCDRFNASGSRWLVWDKHTSCSYAECELAYTSFPGALRKFDYPWNGMIQGYHGDKRMNEQRIHPTQKPVKLYQWMLHNFAAGGQKILDTHLGSGSSAIAAHHFGCEFVGCEIEESYYSAAKKRFKEKTAQKALNF